jgi:Arc/MetJ-type ribon-helix-helix transcriptional regulator
MKPAPIENSSEVVVTFRLPKLLKERLKVRLKGHYSSTSEYMRDLIRQDLGQAANDKDAA